MCVDDIYKDVYKEANETMAFFLDEEGQLNDKALFVKNLGRLINQTREKIEKLSLLDEDTVEITYKGGATKEVNIRLDSYLAIIIDVIKRLN